MWYILKVIKISVFLIIFSSCTNPYRKQAKDALLLADSNRTELEKVLLHYEDDPDILKRVLIKPDGSGTPFYMGCAPGDTAQYFHSYLKPKVFRHFLICPVSRMSRTNTMKRQT